MTNEETLQQIEELEKQITHLRHTTEPVEDKRNINHEYVAGNHYYAISLNDGRLIASVQHNMLTGINTVFIKVNGLTEVPDHYRSALLVYGPAEEGVFHLNYAGISRESNLTRAISNHREIFNADAKNIRSTMTTDLLHEDLYACHVADQALNNYFFSLLPLVMGAHEDMNVTPAFDHAELDKVTRDVMEQKYWAPAETETPSDNQNGIITTSYGFSAVGTQLPLKMTKSVAESHPRDYQMTHIAYDMPNAAAEHMPEFRITADKDSCHAVLSGAFGHVSYETRLNTGWTYHVEDKDKLGEAWRFISDPRVMAGLNHAPAVTKADPGTFHSTIKELTFAVRNEKINPLRKQLNQLKNTQPA